MACCQDILAIPASKHDRPGVAHLSVEQTRRLLALPDRSTRSGRRDATLLATLYDTAARVQELADLTVRDIRLDNPAMAALTGKGRKTRHVPLDGNTAALLTAYLAERHLDSPGHRRPSGVLQPAPSQTQPRRNRLDPSQIPSPRPPIRRSSTPASVHTSCATAGPCTSTTAVFRCPTSVTSSATSTCPRTEIYARASTEAKRKALEAVYADVVTADLAEWNQDPELLELARQPLAASGIMRSVRSPAPPPPAATAQRCA